MCTESEAKNVSGSKFIDPRCIVHFRPKNDWDGEYGFDWYRNEYDNIVGKYDPDDPDEIDDCELIHDNKGLIESYRKKYIKLENNKTEPYLVPWMSLWYKALEITYKGDIIPAEMKDQNKCRLDYYKYQAELELYIEKAEKIERLEFCYINKGEDIPLDKDDSLELHISDSEYPQYNEEGHIIKNKVEEGKTTIKIVYKHPYNKKDWTPNNNDYFSIRVYARHQDGITKTLAGQLNIIKCKPRIVDICLVNVIQYFTDSQYDYTDKIALETQKENLRKYLAQVHIIPNFITIPMKVEFYKKEFDKHKNKSHPTKGIVYISNHGELECKLENRFNEENNLYHNYYKIFFLTKEVYDNKIEVFSKSDTNTAGNALVGTKCAALYMSNNPTRETTIVHELFHCFGLEHSFSNKSDYTYRICKTDNIMDYVYNKKEGDNPSKLMNTWKWQWDIIWDLTDKQNSGLRTINLKKYKVY